MSQDISFGDIVVDCNNSAELCEFYAKLLGWKKVDVYGKPAVRSDDGLLIQFVQEEDYIPPVWPEQPGEQQKQMHLDFLVSDVQEFVRKAENLGAVKADTQFGGNYFTTMVDPAGHLFCLCRNS